MLSFFVAIQVALISVLRAGARRASVQRSRCRGGSSGQATAEYALVLLGAAAIALLLAAWAAKSGKVAQLFDVVVGRLIDDAR